MTPQRASYRYYELVMAAFVTVLICSNLIGPAKIAQLELPVLGTVTFGAGVLFFPISYVFGDVLTEVYGYARARRVIWCGFGALAFASVIAYFCGEFVNSFVLAKMKIATQGRWLWARTIGSTIFGEAIDSALFYPLAFYNSGIIPNDKLPLVMVAQFVTKVVVEVVFTPVTYKIVGALKKAENEDYYDRNTDFSPFTLKA